MEQGERLSLGATFEVPGDADGSREHAMNRTPLMGEV